MEKTGANEKGDQRKHTKKRKRHIYNSICQQMEFYFGDSNLQKDRFMKKLIEEDSYVPLEVFLTFNKIKSLTDSVEKIAKALTESELLELDETKQKVRRKTPLNVDENVDNRTIYVEALPANVDHDWMKNMFKRFGKVTYVSLPKYAKSRKPKDFGFIEFENEKSVESALKMFRAFNGVLCTETTDPAKLASIKSHHCKQETEEEVMETDTTAKAAKRPMPEVEIIAAKKPKLEEPNAKSDESEEEEEGETDENEGEEEKKEEGTTETKKKRRKHKKSAEKRKKQLELTTDASFYELKILPKREWKRLRNRYLNLQRAKTSELKRAAAKERQQQLAKENTINSNPMTDVGSGGGQVVGGGKKTTSKHEERRMHKMKMNFYGAGGVETEANQPTTKLPSNKNAKTTKAESTVSMNFERGLIVEVQFEKPCVDIKDFKKEMRKNKSVKYVDVAEGAMVGFLRLETPLAAEDFVKGAASGERQFDILKGEAEIAYFEKIERDRQSKLNKEIKVPSKRGREKVKAALVSKHIFFNDENGD